MIPRVGIGTNNRRPLRAFVPDVELYYTNFGTGADGYPLGWTEDGAAGIWSCTEDETFIPASTGYAGASGGKKLQAIDVAIGTSYVISPQIDTTGYNNIRLVCGMFLCAEHEGILIPDIEYSINGSDWSSIGVSSLLTDPVSTWKLYTISLPTDASNISTLQLRYKAEVDFDTVTKCWGVDDFKIIGDEL